MYGGEPFGRADVYRKIFTVGLNSVVKMRTCVFVLASHTHDDVTPGRRYLSPFEADPLTAEHHSNL